MKATPREPGQPGSAQTKPAQVKPTPPNYALMTLMLLKLALRISRRDAVRSKGRAALIMVMIGLPVLVITGALTFAATSDVTLREGLVRELGAADLWIKTTEFDVIREQWGTTGDPGLYSSEERTRTAPTTAEEVAKRLPSGTRLIGFDEGRVYVRRANGYQDVSATEIDLRDPMTRGMRPLVEGRYPVGPAEVAVTKAMGFHPGDTIKVTREDRQVQVVGVVEYPFSANHVEVIGFRGILLQDKRDGSGTGWLADTPSPATVTDTRRLNEIGLIGVSRLTADWRWPWSYMGGNQAPKEAVMIALIAFMVTAETVFLAGPAFAIGLRRRRTELALIAAQGGSKTHLRAIVVADGLVLGGVASVVGAVAGTAGGLLLVPLLSDTVGPAEVPWWQVIGVAVLGLLSGVASALVPARQAARHDTAAVLAGRSAIAPDRAGKPVLGFVFVIVSVLASLLATGTELVWILGAAVLGLPGMVLLTPWIVKNTGRLAVRLPLALRLSVRDAVRHRVRTASAVAAVMTATMGAVMVGIGTYSEQVDSRESFHPPVPVGTLSIDGRDTDDATWTRIRTTAERRLPGVELVGGYAATDPQGRRLLLTALARSRCGRCEPSPRLTVGDQRLLDLMQGGHDPRTAAALAEGKAIAFIPSLVRNGTVSVAADYADGHGSLKKFELPAVAGKTTEPSPAVVLVSPAAMTAKGWRLDERELFTRRQPPKSENLLYTELRLISPEANVYVERGFQSDISVRVLLLIGSALILVLGGTLAATALAAADMRPDLATVSAIGARPTTGRLVVGGQAAYIAGLGALIGAVAGVVPGISLAWLSTLKSDRILRFGSFQFLEEPGAATIAVPWSLIGVLVIGLPSLTALVAAAFTWTGTPALARRLA